MSLIGETKFTILRELEDGPAHGYAIAEALDISSGGVYNHLSDLRDEGMIEIAEESEGGRQQKYYKLTDDGHLLVEALSDEK